MGRSRGRNEPAVRGLDVMVVSVAEKREREVIGRMENDWNDEQLEHENEEIRVEQLMYAEEDWRRMLLKIVAVVVVVVVMQMVAVAAVAAA